ncbi:ferritin-like domain-containing protein [Changchengzhania lutea]|uniref:ferritin-like domain-containing protein n=1 Tax=Changchengzhania lutea TaxID=2049305 RepID=UPI00115EA4A6|nr:PA2169 family four-helix-bundle protein [Changchengzhania lutea]
MYDYTEEVGNKLNDLLEKNYDAEKGYRKAAENAKSDSLKRFFNRKAAERNSFGHEIKSELKTYGQEPDKGGSVTGALHRTWMDTKALFSSDNDESMLEAAITGERAALDDYEDALSDNEPRFPERTASILKNQWSQIQSDLNKIKRLEDIS